MNERTRKAFTSQPMISYGTSCNRTVGCLKCVSKRCEICKHITEIGTFTSTVIRIIHRFDCNDKCLVLMTCNKC